MKIGVTILFVLISVAFGFAQTAYVAAPSGLKLRKTAAANGEVVKTLPYGTKLISVADKKPKAAHKTKEAEGLYLKGFRQKVTVDKDTGYVFDAFLMPVEPIGKKEVETYYDDTTRGCKPFDIYFLESRFKAVGKPYDLKSFASIDTAYWVVTDKNDPYCQQGFSQKFANSNIVASYSQGEGGASMDVTLKGYTFNQVYAIALSMTTMMNEGVSVSYNSGVVSIGPKDDGAGCYSTIEVKGNTIIWNFGCGC
ncbi:MAG: hypothetical protein M0D57_06620 [Sphingobacteriales bacterium JAD_PAG50586_3]|nr:MAG: hypothetical protein M0D57_06620 [Sphingobacteriales bacterium JAD_PAG50586_3]